METTFVMTKEQSLILILFLEFCHFWNIKIIWHFSYIYIFYSLRKKLNFKLSIIDMLHLYSFFTNRLYLIGSFCFNIIYHIILFRTDKTYLL